MNPPFTTSPGDKYIYCSFSLLVCQLTLPVYARQPYPITTSSTHDSEVAAPTPLLRTFGHFIQHLQKANRVVEWVYDDGEDTVTNVSHYWIARVLVDGMYLRSGKGRTKKKARNEAAKEGLMFMCDCTCS
jgi:Double-stranded RNA binding motif